MTPPTATMARLNKAAEGTLPDFAAHLKKCDLTELRRRSRAFQDARRKTIPGAFGPERVENDTEGDTAEPTPAAEDIQTVDQLSKFVGQYPQTLLDYLAALREQNEAAEEVIPEIDAVANADADWQRSKAKFEKDYRDTLETTQKLWAQVDDLTAEKNKAQKEAAKYHTSLQEAREELQESQDDNTRLKDELEAVQQFMAEEPMATSTPLATTSPAGNQRPTKQPRAQSSRRPHIKWPDAPILTDGNDPTFDEWELKIQAKCKKDFHSDDDKKEYILSRTGGQVSKYLLPHVRRGALHPFKTSEEVLEFIEQQICDPDRRGTARSKLHDLRQGTDSFGAFYAEFAAHIAELGYGQRSQVDELVDRVSDRLRHQYAVSDNQPTTLVAARAFFQRLDNNLRSHDKMKASRQSRSAPAAPTKPKAPPGIAFKPLVRPGRTTVPTPTPARLTGGAKVERKDANGCYNCGESGHYSKDCPQPKIKKERINAIDEGDENEPDTSSELSSSHESADEEFDSENA